MKWSQLQESLYEKCKYTLNGEKCYEIDVVKDLFMPMYIVEVMGRV